MHIIRLKSAREDEEVDRLAAELLDQKACDQVVDHDADVLKPDGSVLLKFRRGVIPLELGRTAFQALKGAAKVTMTRGYAGGTLGDDETASYTVGTRSKTGFHALKADGTISSTRRTKPVHSGIIGYFDRKPRLPFCRMTQFNLEEPEKFAAALPFIQRVSREFKRHYPERHAAQLAVIKKTHPDFYIHGTVFTTITVNRNWQTAVHKDAGDLRAGFGVMTVLERGLYRGGYLTFPKYGVGVDMRSGDLLLADVHEWHGNTPLESIIDGEAWERLSFVFYYREHMVNCGSAEEELEIAKLRVKGTALTKTARELLQEVRKR